MARKDEGYKFNSAKEAFKEIIRLIDENSPNLIEKIRKIAVKGMRK